MPVKPIQQLSFYGQEKNFIKIRFPVRKILIKVWRNLLKFHTKLDICFRKVCNRKATLEVVNFLCASLDFPGGVVFYIMLSEMFTSIPKLNFKLMKYLLFIRIVKRWHSFWFIVCAISFRVFYLFFEIYFFSKSATIWF